MRFIYNHVDNAHSTSKKPQKDQKRAKQLLSKTHAKYTKKGTPKVGRAACWGIVVDLRDARLSKFNEALPDLEMHISEDPRDAHLSN